MDLATVGQVMFMLTAEDSAAIDSAVTFHRGFAGAEYNVAVGLARLEFNVALVTHLGSDAVGNAILEQLAVEKIDASCVTTTTSRSNAIKLKGCRPSGDSEALYWYERAAALDTPTDEGIEGIVSTSKILHVTGVFPSLSPQTRCLLFHLVDIAKESDVLISFDPNLRPNRWTNSQLMVSTLNHLARYADIVLPGLDEGTLLTGGTTPAQVADAYMQLGAKMVAIKLGVRGGGLLVTEGGSWTYPAYQVEPVDTSGAGDGFAVGVLSGVLDDLPPQEIIARGTAIGAMAVTSKGDSDAYPTRQGLQNFVATHHLTAQPEDLRAP